MLTIAAVLSSFGIMYGFSAYAGSGTSPAILSAALTVGLMRRPEDLKWRALAVKFISLPLIALGAGIVGIAFLRLPLLGAVLFCAGIAVSIALRRFGEIGAALGRTIALPLLTILVVPVAVTNTSGRVATFLLVFAAGAVAFTCATIASYLGARLKIACASDLPPQRASSASKAGMHVSTRMALQMLVALSLGFGVGFLLFPAHWPWVVLSAFIVCSGAVSRGDAIYKALLRLTGAVGGTFAAAALASIAIGPPVADAALVFLVLFAGIWLREINYAYWAACATLIFALLQGSGTGNAFALFGERVLCIFIGASCGVVATWFVYPIRTEQLVRRRVADALGAMREALGGGTPDLDRHAAELRRVAPPMRLHRALFGAKSANGHPATWIERAHELLTKLRAQDYDAVAAAAELRTLGALIRNNSAGTTAELQRRSKPPR